jgi:hypothetical protein
MEYGGRQSPEYGLASAPFFGRVFRVAPRASRVKLTSAALPFGWLHKTKLQFFNLGVISTHSSEKHPAEMHGRDYLVTRPRIPKNFGETSASSVEPLSWAGC